MPGKLISILFVSASYFLFHSSLAAQQTAPAPYPSDVKINYIRTWDATKPTTDGKKVTLSVQIDSFRMATQYFDGLGQPIQTVIKQGSLSTGSSAIDLVSPMVYDSFGREQVKYLSFAANNTGGNSHINDGLFKLNPFQQDSTFNKNLFADENWFYGQTIFESSPRNNVTKVMASGNNWAGASRGIKSNNWFNTITDSVRIWTVTDVSNNFGTYSTNALYVPGELYKTVTTDEHGKEVVEFKDKQEKVVLKKIQLTSLPDTGSGKGYSGWLCTYYIYDDLDNLRCVIQPRGVELIASSWTLTDATILAEQCFRYEYDKRGRMIMKKVPGAGTVWMVYDLRDRLVLTQDSLMRATHQWLYTQYDALNRPIATGLLTDNNNLAYHTTRADTSIFYPAAGTYTVDTLTKTFYDDYTWRGGQGNPLSSTRSTSYDSYLQTASNTTWPYPQDATGTTGQLKGMVTGTKTKIITTSGSMGYLFGITFYDEKARVAQVQSQNITTGTDIVTTQYSWTGQVLLNIIKNEKAVTNAQTSIVLTQTTYDSLGRVVKIEKKASNTKVNSGSMPGSWKTIAQNEYNALGQLRKKILSPSGGAGGGPLDSLNYEYNIRGWMLGMNRSYIRDTLSTANWFGFDLGYDKTSFTINGNSKSYAAAQYNGNITGMLWKSNGDDQLRKYDFTYDAVNRLTGADFNQLTNNNFSKSTGIDFSVSGLNYDANGNILNMNQRGWKVGGSVTIDSLLYTYISNSNKLLNVLDRKNDTATRLGDFRSSKAYITSLSNNKTTSATDYSYDANGNMYVDNNKDISNIHYNFLNLPDSITVTNKGNIKYVYDVTGNKLKKITTEGSKVTTTLYLFGNYVNDTLQYLPQEEGRIRFNVPDSSFQYDYFIKDHLGNVRMLLTEQQKTDAYPVASLEASSLSTEKQYYSNLDTGRTQINTVSGYPSDTYTNPNAWTQKLNGNGAKIGAGIVLKVMAGDKFTIFAKSWWNSTNSPDPAHDPFNDLLNALNTGVSVKSSSHFTATDLSSNNALNSGLTNFLTSHTGYNTGRPKAFINWVLFDEQFKFVSSSSGFEQVGASNNLTTHSRPNLTLDRNGYLYIYVSNETPNIDVFFDNLQVTQIRGPLLEETHYYPFGLSMAGISSKALAFGDPENKKKKFQGQEYNEDLGVDIYEFKYRMDDPQIGRFWQTDPLANKYTYNSTYAFSENHVTAHVELEGLEKESINKEEKKDPGGVTFTIQDSRSFESDGPLFHVSGEVVLAQVTGNEGKMSNTDIAVTMSRKMGGRTLSLGPFNIGLGEHASVTFGVSGFGNEVHVGLGKDGIISGASTAGKKGTVLGVEIKAAPKPLLVGLVAGALIQVTTGIPVIPALAPATLTVGKQQPKASKDNPAEVKSKSTEKKKEINLH